MPSTIGNTIGLLPIKYLEDKKLYGILKFNEQSIYRNLIFSY